MTTMVELARKDGFVVGLLGATIVLYYEQTPTMEATRVGTIAMSRALTWLTQAVVLVVIAPGARAPELAVREEIQRSMQTMGDKITATAYVILGDGFANAAARAAVSGMLLFARPQYATKVFATTSDALSWLRSYADSTPDVGQLGRVHALERFCSPSGAELH